MTPSVTAADSGLVAGEAWRGPSRTSFEAPKRTEFTVIREIGNIQGCIDGTGYLSLAGTITNRIDRVDEDGIVVTFESKTKDDAHGREGLSLYSIRPVAEVGRRR